MRWPCYYILPVKHARQEVQDESRENISSGGNADGGDADFGGRRGCGRNGYGLCGDGEEFFEEGGQEGFLCFGLSGHSEGLPERDELF